MHRPTQTGECSKRAGETGTAKIAPLHSSGSVCATVLPVFTIEIALNLSPERATPESVLSGRTPRGSAFNNFPTRKDGTMHKLHYATVIALLISLIAPAVAQQTAAPKTTPAPTAPPITSPTAPALAGGSTSQSQTGLAAVYSDRLHGRKTASGAVYNRNALTTAHPSLPFGTRVRITNMKNNRSVDLTVNDRGPTQPDRIVDISRAAAVKLGIRPKAMGEVKLEVIGEKPPAGRRVKIS